MESKRKLMIFAFLICVMFSFIKSQTEVTTYSYNPPQYILPRQKAPYWSGIAVEGEKFVKKSAEDYKGKYLVIIFYPFDFTYVCPTELISFSENIEKFKQINANIIGVSTDSHFTHLAWIKTARSYGGLGKMNFPLFADISKKMSKHFGVLVENEDDELFGAALRGLFIIDDKGIIRSFTINDASVGRSVEETLRLIEAFQYSDKYGEVCPANWKPGDSTIKPDPEDKKEYFEKKYGN
jgi:alkyl hydroperoxide reductase subunit AhpC